LELLTEFNETFVYDNVVMPSSRPKLSLIFFCIGHSDVEFTISQNELLYNISSFNLNGIIVSGDIDKKG